MHMTVSKYLNGTWSMNNLIDKGNFKKQNRCLWTEAGGGASLDAGVKQNWQKSSVIFLSPPPISVIYRVCIYMSTCSVSKWCGSFTASFCLPLPPPNNTNIFTANFHTKDFSTEFVVLNILVNVSCTLSDQQRSSVLE